jgi:hypothetical protein
MYNNYFEAEINMAAADSIKMCNKWRQLTAAIAQAA